MARYRGFGSEVADCQEMGGKWVGGQCVALDSAPPSSSFVTPAVVIGALILGALWLFTQQKR
jgi:hypothetical protein